MTVDHVLQLYVANINSVVLWLALFVLALIAFYLILALRQEKFQLEGAGGDISKLEETLKKVLETAQIGAPATRESTAATAGEAHDGGVPPAINLEEIEKLKTVAQAKDARILELEAKIATAEKAGASPDELEALKKKLREVEAKLSEYEIIEDDIANLSLYKDENARLKDEIDKLKAGGAVPVQGAPPAADATPAAVEVAQPAAESQAAAPDATASPVAVENPITDDLMAEFEAAVTQQLSTDTNKKPENEIPPMPEPEAAKEHDLMAEFEAAVKGQKASETPPVNQAAVRQAMDESADADLMSQFKDAVDKQKEQEETDAPVEAAAKPEVSVAQAAPVAGLVTPSAKPDLQIVEAASGATEPAPKTEVAPVEEAVPSSLAVTIDADQMLSELQTFTPPADGAEETGDEGDKLIQEFENFVKGSSS